MTLRNRSGGHPQRPRTLAFSVPTTTTTTPTSSVLRQWRISRKFFNLNMFRNANLYRRLNRWERGWTLQTNPIPEDFLNGRMPPLST